LSEFHICSSGDVIRHAVLNTNRKAKVMDITWDCCFATPTPFKVDGYLNSSCVNAEGHAVCLIVMFADVYDMDFVRTMRHCVCRAEMSLMV
jgi:hypothetical protein